MSAPTLKQRAAAVARSSASGANEVYMQALIAAQAERIERLEAALRMAIRQNEHDMLMTGDELREAGAALAEGEKP